jgi:anti-sigma regulatory factor (Ser/Thr protein kinase)
MCWSRNLADVVETVAMRRTLADFLRRAFASGNTTDEFYAAELIIGELLSNVVRYTPGTLCIEFSEAAGAVELIMHDAGRGVAWNPVLPLDRDAERGRGMYIVSALATSVNATNDVNGSRISVVLPLKAQPAAIPKPGCPLDRLFSDPSVCPRPRALASGRLR